jgi:hypothetical protein
MGDAIRSVHADARVSFRPIFHREATDYPLMDASAWRDRLPRGQTLAREVWARRHKAITTIARLHVPLLVAFGLVTDHSLGDSLSAATCSPSPTCWSTTA